MPKHKSSKKRLRKRVRRNVQKVKEITAEEILLNPSIVYTPQFKALPLEKQFQLMSQVRQLKSLGRTTAVPTYVTSGTNVDPTLLSRVNEASSKVSQQANENAQLRIALDAANREYKREKALNKEIKRKAEDDKRLFEQADRIEDLEHERFRLDARLSKLNHASEGRQRIASEQYLQNHNNNISSQAIFQNQFNSFTENGDAPKADATEQLILSFSDDDPFTLKKTSIIDDEQEGEESPFSFIPPKEQQAMKIEIEAADQVQTRKELIEQAEELEKQRQKTRDAADILTAQNTYELPQTHAGQMSFEEEKSNLIQELNEICQTSSKMPPDQLKRILRMIQDATSFKELKGIRAMLHLYTLDQETSIKQQDNERAKQQELAQKRLENRQAYERAKGQYVSLTPNSVDALIIMEDDRKKALEALDSLMKITPNPNDKYRYTIGWHIQHATTTTALAEVMKKIQIDTTNLKDELESYEKVQEQRKELIDKVYDKTWADCNHFELNLWIGKIKQAQSPEDIAVIDKTLDEVRYVALEKRNHPEHLERPQSAQRIRSTLAEAGEFLKSPPKYEKRVLFYNGGVFKILDQNTQQMSPSIDHELVDLRTYNVAVPPPPPPPPKKGLLRKIGGAIGGAISAINPFS